MRYIESKEMRLTTVELTDEEIVLIHALACTGESGDDTQPPRVRQGAVTNGRYKGGVVIAEPFEELLRRLALKPLEGLAVAKGWA